MESAPPSENTIPSKTENNYPLENKENEEKTNTNNNVQNVPTNDNNSNENKNLSPTEKDQNNIKENDNLNINKEIKKKKKKEKEEKSKYILEVKKYLNFNVKDFEYMDIIKNNPDSLFETIKEGTIMKWEIKLFNNFSYTKTTTDEMIESIERNMPYQNIIKNDSIRTRVRESILIENFKDTLEKMITYYCTVKNIYYKQGLNEIFGPLILMKHKFKQLKLSKIFLWGDLFIDRFLPNYFYEKEFYSLKCSLAVFVILLKYHEPSVYNRLDKMEMMPEMYATNWLMTLMSGKVKLDLLFVLWDYIIEHDDPLFMHFVLVALLKYKRELIINCDKSLLPPLISNLTMTSKEELKIIMDLADELVKKTPYSFRILVNKLGFLVPKNKNVQENYELYKPQTIPAMPIFPLETFYITYDNIISCPDPDCENEKGFQKIKTGGKIKYKLDFNLIENPNVDDYGEKMQVHICEKCNMNVEKNLNFILIDLRILENELNKEDMQDKIGILPKMINLKQEELKSEELSEILADKFIEERGKYHFIFLTTTTDTFSKFESNFYKDNITEQDKKKMIYGLMEPKKVDKQLDLKAGNLSSQEIYKLKEYDNLRETLKSMQKQNYPYVSFVYGGFYKIHEESIKLDIELPSHDPENCSLCFESKERNKSKNQKNEEEKEKNKLYELLWKHKKRIKYKDLTQYFNDPKISVCFGSLIEYKTKSLLYEKIQILIALLFSQFKIEIYKFDIRKQHNSDKPSYYDLGVDDEEQKDRELIILEELKVSDIVGMNVDKKIKNILHLNIKVKNQKKGENKSKKNENEKYESYNMVIDLSSSNDSRNFFKAFKDMSVEYKNQYKNKLENKKDKKK